MGKKIQAVKGMNDLLPIEQKDFKLTSAFWQAFEEAVVRWTRRFGYQQIRTPIVEQTGLFVRSIGEETDVVGKEMYTFSDSNDALSLSVEHVKELGNEFFFRRKVSYRRELSQIDDLAIDDDARR